MDTVFFGVGVLLLFGVASFRGCGYDYENYHGIFLNCQMGHWEDQDFGFAWLASIMPSYRALLIAMSALTFIPLYYCTKRLSPIPIFSLLLLYPVFFLPSAMGQMRQGVAMFFILTAYVVRDKKLPCIILLLASMLMHTAAVIGLLYFLPLRKQYRLHVYIIVFVVSIFIGASLEHFLARIMSLSDLWAAKYAAYYSTETLEGLSLGLNTAVLIRCFIFVLMYYMLPGTAYDNPRLLNLYFMSIVLYLAFGFIPQIGGRGSFYFSILDVFLIPQLICVASSKNKRLVLSMAFILLSVLRYAQFFLSEFNYDSYVPYNFCHVII